MASIKVKYRPSANVGNEGTIYYQVIHERRTRQIATDYRVKPSEWDSRRKTVCCGADKERMSYLLMVREKIRMDLERFVKIIRNLEKRTFIFSTEDIVEEYERIVKENSLFRFIEGLIVKMKYHGRLRTAETYRAALNSFKNYRNGEDLLIDCMDRDVMESYELWLRQQGKAPNTVSFYTRILRAVYNRAVEEGLTEDRTPFRKVYTGIDKTVKRALPIETIRQIRSMDLTVNPEIDYARDIFILSFMLRGMSFIDMAFLKKTDLKNGYVTYRRRKTGQILMIEWTEDMQAIVDKYPTVGTEYLLPILRNPNAIAYYAYRNIGYSINRRLKSISESLQLPMPLTMYVARHSWASAAKSRGIPMNIISEGMGHESELTTRIYLANLDTTAVDQANSILLREIRR